MLYSKIGYPFTGNPLLYLSHNICQLITVNQNELNLNISILPETKYT